MGGAGPRKVNGGVAQCNLCPSFGARTRRSGIFFFVKGKWRPAHDPCERPPPARRGALPKAVVSHVFGKASACGVVSKELKILEKSGKMNLSGSEAIGKKIKSDAKQRCNSVVFFVRMGCFCCLRAM